MSKFWIIATDVYKKNVKSLSFLIMILAPFLLVGIVYLAGSLASGFQEILPLVWFRKTKRWLKS